MPPKGYSESRDSENRFFYYFKTGPFLFPRGEFRYYLFLQKLKRMPDCACTLNGVTIHPIDFQVEGSESLILFYDHPVYMCGTKKNCIII